MAAERESLEGLSQDLPIGTYNGGSGSFVNIKTSGGIELVTSGVSQGEYLPADQITKSTVELDQVDNTSDLNKPLSIATSAALADLETEVDGNSLAIVSLSSDVSELETEVDNKVDSNPITDITSVEGVVLSGGTGSSNTGSSTGDYGWNNLGNYPNDPNTDAGELARAGFNTISDFRVVIDFGEDLNLSTINYINYIQANNGSSDRGVKSCKLYCADSGWTPTLTYNDLTGLSTAVFDGDLHESTNPSDEQSIQLTEVTTTQYIVIDVIDNQGNANYCGLRSLWGGIGTGMYSITVGDDTVSQTYLKGEVYGDINLSDDNLSKLDYPRTTVSQRVSPEPKSKILASTFDGGASEWPFTGNGSVDYYDITEHGTCGDGVTRIVSTGTAAILKTFASPIDLSTKRVCRLKHRLDQAGSVNDDGIIKVRLLTSNPAAYIDIDLTGHIVKRCWSGIDQYMYADVSFADGADMFTTITGTPDYTDITGVEIIVEKDTGASQAIFYMDELVFFESELEKAKLCFCWDDGFSTLPTKEVPLMSKYGIVGEVGLVGKEIPDGSISVDYYQELQRIGWEVDNHTYDYTWKDATTLEELEEVFFASWDVMAKYGMNSKDIFLYPDGDTQSTLDGIKNLISKYTRCARLTGDINAFTNQWPTSEPHRLYSLGFRDTLSLSEALQALDQAVAEKSLFINYCHYLTTGAAGGVTWNDADMETYLQAVKGYVDAGLLETTTMSDVFS